MAGIRCDRCGLFCRPADEGTYYGSGNDTEPPDPILWCHRCAEGEYRDAIKAGRVIDCFWRKPAWQRRAAKKLGWVEVHDGYAAWSLLVPPNRVPKGYVRVRRAR